MGVEARDFSAGDPRCLHATSGVTGVSASGVGDCIGTMGTEVWTLAPKKSEQVMEHLGCSRHVAGRLEY